jgi:hypothetical protein
VALEGVIPNGILFMRFTQSFSTDRTTPEVSVMGPEMQDIERIRTARILCIQHRFEEAINVARKVEDPETRNTLLFICKSFQASQIKVHAA